MVDVSIKSFLKKEEAKREKQEAADQCISQ